MALPESEWLHLAKRAPLHGSGRHRHLRESRPNLVVKNLGDRYTAYCMACKQGGVHLKEHVRVTGVQAPATSLELSLPGDMQPLALAEKAVQDAVLGFLAHKNMDLVYLDCPVFFSRQRMRVLLNWDGGWLGRDTTERSPQKWLTMNRQTHLDPQERCPTAVVVEDPFSFFKVRWALRDVPVCVYSSLGTAVPDSLAMKLLAHDKVLFMYDGDAAGYKGAERESKRFRAFNVPSFMACAPDGKDPKDLSILEIKEHVNVLSGVQRW